MDIEPSSHGDIGRIRSLGTTGTALLSELAPYSAIVCGRAAVPHVDVAYGMVTLLCTIIGYNNCTVKR